VLNVSRSADIYGGSVGLIHPLGPRDNDSAACEPRLLVVKKR